MNNTARNTCVQIFVWAYVFNSPGNEYTHIHTHICGGVSGLVTKSCLTLCDSMDYIACQAPLSMGFPRQEYWSRLPFLSPGDLPDTGITPSPAWQEASLPLSRLRSPNIHTYI